MQRYDKDDDLLLAGKVVHVCRCFISKRNEQGSKDKHLQNQRLRCTHTPSADMTTYRSNGKNTTCQRLQATNR